MTKDQHQTAQNMKSGTSDKSSAKKGRIQIPDFEPPVSGVKGTIPHQSPNPVDIESAAAALLAKTQDAQDEQIMQEGEEEYLASQEIEPGVVEIAPPTREQMTVTREQMTVENLYKMVQDLQARGAQQASNIDSRWADAVNQGHTNVELDPVEFTSLVQRYKEKPSSVVYKDVRFFKKGTMSEILETETENVDFKRGLSKHKHSHNRFKGRK